MRFPSSRLLLALVLIQTLTISIGIAAPRNRVLAKIDNNRRATLHGNLSPRATAGADEGSVEADLEIPYVTLVLKPSDAQQADLDKFLQEQQGPSSPNYHHWLTPEEYADRFGVSQADLDKLTTWLSSQNLTVKAVARGRGWVAVGGTAYAVQQAFGAKIHRYKVNGETHFANATDPSIPVAFEPIVSAIRGLNNFRLKPKPTSRAIQPSEISPVDPRYNSSRGSHFLAPDDLATIYNIKPLYQAGIDGSGQKIVVVGQTQIDLADIRQFRNFFNLPENDPQVIPEPDKRALPSWVPPAENETVPDGVAVAVPVTVAVIVTDPPEVTVVELALNEMDGVVADGVEDTRPSLHAVTRLYASTDPSPVTGS